MNKQILFSDRLILLADMKDTFISWFKQRLRWESGKWRLLKRYYKEIFSNPHTISYYFASPTLLSAILSSSSIISLGYTSLLSLSIIKKKKLNNFSFRKKLKEIYFYAPLLGLFSKFFLYLLLFTPFYYYYPIKKELKNNNLKKDDFNIISLYLLLGYSTFYLTVIQPLGILYAIYKNIKK